MTEPIEFLQGDREHLTDILQSRRDISVEAMPTGARLLWQVYLRTLQEALAALEALIAYLSPQSE